MNISIAKQFAKDLENNNKFQIGHSGAFLTSFKKKSFQFSPTTIAQGPEINLDLPKSKKLRLVLEEKPSDNVNVAAYGDEFATDKIKRLRMSSSEGSSNVSRSYITPRKTTAQEQVREEPLKRAITLQEDL